MTFGHTGDESSFFATLNKDTLSIPDFCDMARFGEIMKEWAVGTGLATLAQGRHGEYITPPFNFKAFCAELNRKNPEGARRCIESDNKGNGVYRCHAGLIDFSAPITLEDGTVLGRIIGGQVLSHEPDEAHFRQIAKELGIDEEKYVKAVHEVKVRSQEEIDASFHLLSLVIDAFVRASYSAMLTELGLEERSHVIASLGNLYEADYVLNLSQGVFHELSANAFWHEKSTKAHTNQELILQLLPLIPPLEKEGFLAFNNLATLPSRLRPSGSLALEIPLTGKGWYRLVYIAVSGAENAPLSQAILALQNIDEERKKEIANENRLLNALNEANRANAAKTDFLSRMSHDIRTPLNGVVGMCYLAQAEKNPPATQDYLQKIDTSSKFLLGLINDVLDMAKVESNKIVLHPVPYSLAEFNAYIDSVIRPLCAEKNISLSVNYEMPDGYIPLQDKLRINQIVFNLLSNAVKFTPEGGKVSYFCSFTKMPNEEKLWMKMVVKDNGIGMSEEFQHQLFTPFSQESRNDSSSARGSGLGLAICKKMVTLMSGSIRAESHLGQGTTFTVEGAFAAVRVDSAHPYLQEMKNPAEDLDSLKGKRILVFEDHPLNQEIARKLLEKKGAIVDLADNGLRGLLLFQRSSVYFYDAILMDIRMPVMDGYEATSALRRLARADAKTIPIIAMTADAFSDDVAHCLAMGMNAHLAKPIDPSTLYSTLQKELAKSGK